MQMLFTLQTSHRMMRNGREGSPQRLSPGCTTHQTEAITPASSHRPDSSEQHLSIPPPPPQPHLISARACTRAFRYQQKKSGKQGLILTDPSPDPLFHPTFFSLFPGLKECVHNQTRAKLRRKRAHSRINTQYAHIQTHSLLTVAVSTVSESRQKDRGAFASGECATQTSRQTDPFLVLCLD